MFYVLIESIKLLGRKLNSECERSRCVGFAETDLQLELAILTANAFGKSERLSLLLRIRCTFFEEKLYYSQLL